MAKLTLTIASSQPQPREGRQPASPLPEEAGDSAGAEIWTAFNNSAGTLERFQRYMTIYDNKFYRALHELQRLQAARRGQKVAPPAALDLTVSNPDSRKEMI